MRTKKINGEDYILFSHKKNIFFNKEELNEAIINLKTKGHKVRSINCTGCSNIDKYTIWIKN